MGTGAAKPAVKETIATSPIDSKQSSSGVDSSVGTGAAKPAVRETTATPPIDSKHSSSGDDSSVGTGAAKSTVKKASAKPPIDSKHSSSGSDSHSFGTGQAHTFVDSDDDINVGSDIHRALITAAIDFGTTNSGFAFVFKDSLDEVQVNKWILGAADKEKAPTTVLLKQDKSFYSFGYRAEDDYAKLCESRKQKGWRYFHNFKMALYEKSKLSRDTKLFDVENKPMPALEVLSIVIGHLKKEILQTIRIQRPSVVDDEVIYVITVPAIWSDAAKQFMREAATSQEAGIHNDQLKLVLEPEAASVYCSRQRVVKATDGSSGEQFLPVPEGQTYILVDIGGGTLDMATHEVIAGGRLHEKYVARGDDKGGHNFNKKFLEFLKKLFGPDCFRKWKTTECGDFLDMERHIEDIKRKVGERDDDVKFKVEHTLLEHYKKYYRGKDIDTLKFKKGFEDHVIGIRKGYIIFKHSFLRDFLKETVVAIETYLTKILNDDPSINLIFLVGGLAKSPYVRQYVESRFPDCRVVVPEDPGVAVLKGAVLLGNSPQTIASRIARYSYGIAARDDFIPGVDKEEYKVTVDGVELCGYVFEKLIEKGQVLQYGQRFTTETVVNAKLPETKQNTFTTYLYQSTQTSPMYTTEDGCSFLGGFEKQPPEGGWSDYCESQVELIVGEAEFKLQISDDLGRCYKTKIDFLLPSE